MDLNCFVDPNYRGPSLIRGYLKKLKCDKAMMKFLKKFNKRYFILDLGNYIFYYQEKENSSMLQKFDLKELIRIDSNPRIMEVCDWKFAFTVYIGNKVLTLYADSASAHTEWCNGFRACIRPVLRMDQGETLNDPRASEYVQDKIPESYNKKPEFKIENQKNAEIAIAKNTEKTHEPDAKKYQEHDAKSNQELDYKKKQNVDVGNNGKDAMHNRGKHNEPNRFVVVTSDNREISSKARNHDEDEDDIKVITEAKNIKKNDDLDRVVPVIFAKERPMSKRGVTPIINREEVKEVRIEERKQSNYARANSVNKERVVFNQNGIHDMMNELDGLGLDKLEVRSGVEFRQKVSASRTMKTDNFKDSQNSTNTSESQKNNLGYFHPEPSEKSRSFKTKENISRDLTPSDPNARKLNYKGNEKKQPEHFVPEPAEKKSGLSGLSYRPISNKIPAKPKFMEKPEIVPDEEIVKARNEKVVNNKPPSNRDRMHKEKAVYKEKNPNLNPQGSDCDWDNWDD